MKEPKMYHYISFWLFVYWVINLVWGFPPKEIINTRIIEMLICLMTLIILGIEYLRDYMVYLQSKKESLDV